MFKNRRKEEYNKRDPFEDFEWFVETDFEDDNWYEKNREINDYYIDNLEEEEILNKW